MKKSFRKLIPAILMVLLSASLMGTSTFAWFAMNRSATITGMTVTTRVSNNLLIAQASNTAVTNAPSAAMPAASEYKTVLREDVGGLLEPVSSITGLYNAFWYAETTNVKANGDAQNDHYIEYDTDGVASATGYANAFNKNYGIGSSDPASPAVAYVDYVFAVQANNTSTTDPWYINITKCDLTYRGDDLNSSKAFRLAVLVQTDADTYATAASKTILAVTDADYFTKVDHDSDAGTPDVVAAVKDDDELDGITNFRSKATIAEVPANSTKYYKVTLRLWIEGEDTTCTNDTYAKLTNEYDLDIKIELQENDTAAVTVITQTAKEADAWSVAYGATTSSNVVIAGVTYYAYTATGSPTTIYGDANAAADVTKWFNIVSDKEVYEITEFVFNANRIPVTQTLSHVTSSVSATVTNNNADFTATYTAATGYTLTGANLVVKIGGEVLDPSEYTWSAGVLTIDKGDITGDVEVILTAVAE